MFRGAGRPLQSCREKTKKPIHHPAPLLRSTACWYIPWASPGGSQGAAEHPLPRSPFRLPPWATQPAESAHAPTTPEEAAAEKKGVGRLWCPGALSGGLTAMQTPFRRLHYREGLEERREEARR